MIKKNMTNNVYFYADSSQYINYFRPASSSTRYKNMAAVTKKKVIVIAGMFVS